ncbi:zinc finger BED domain-containing protein 4-like [Ixodes scapularis]|uniref:zinc finger BED domain-containing protein 4-like n=1 Tax=Ixodes scapularis TaxID=6945 RepID=UPI001A9F59D5|nr:zinc finger BED domain-containing protein 4-like [Ixodes scapularis]
MAHNKQLAEYIAKSMKPFSMVEDPAFIDFMRFCVPKWNIPSRGYFANSAIPALETVIAEALKVQLKECVGEVHLTTDIWSSRQVNDFMSVTAHWIAPDSKGSLTRNNAVLDMSGFGQQHTAYNIGKKLGDVIETWLVPLGVKVGIVTSDNAQNVVKALNDRGMKRAPCMPHCLNLVVKASLTKSGAELEETLKAARAIVGHFRHSASAQRQLEAIQLRYGLPVHKLLQDVPTRWNSTFYMVERLSEQRRAVSEFFEDSTKHYLAPRQWALLKAMATVLKPFEEATRLLCMDTSTLGQVLPLLTFIERTVTHTMTGAELDTPVFCLASCLLNELSLSRLLNAVKTDVQYWAATLLDPRFRDTLSTHTSEEASASPKLEIVRSYLQQRLQDVHSQACKDKSVAESSPQSAPSTSSGSSPPSDFHSWYTTSSTTTPRPRQERRQTITVVKAQLDAFLEDEGVECYNSQSNPTVYWEKKRYLWPDLYTVAVGYLACPPTSVYSERVFSTAGAIVTDRRNRLTPKNVATLSFIRMNREWIPNILPARVANSLSSAAETAQASAAEEELSEPEEEPFLEKMIFESGDC